MSRANGRSLRDEWRSEELTGDSFRRGRRKIERTRYGAKVGIFLSLVGFTCNSWAASLTEYPIPTAHPGLQSICAGPDGNIWFVEADTSKIGRLELSGEVTEFSLPFINPWGITGGPDGNLWVTESSTSYLAVFSTSGVLLHQYRSSRFAGVAYPGKITAGRDGYLWFTNGGANTVARMRPDGTGLQEFPVPTPAGPNFISIAPDGAAWVSEYDSYVARVAPDGTVADARILSFSAAVYGIAAVADGSAWYVVRDRNKIGHATKDLHLTEYELPHPHSVPYDIVVGPDGALWFTEAANRIGHMTSDGRIAEYQLPDGRGPWNITVGPDGAIWFTELEANMIGRLDPTVFAHAASVQSIPTLSPWAKTFLAILLGMAGFRLAGS